MIYTHLLQCPYTAVAPVDGWLKIGIQSLMLALSVVGTAYFAYLFAVKKLRRETPLLIEREKYNRTLNALQQCWTLLAYMSEVENDKSILIYQQPKGSKERTYYLRRQQADSFMKLLPDLFYTQGHGLYLPREVRPLLYQYRAQLYGILLREKNDTQQSIKLDNAEMIKSMLDTHQQLVVILRKHAGLNDPLLPENE